MVFPEPDPGLDDPLGMLRACHRRVVRYAQLLAAAARGDVDPGAAVAAVERYFSTAGRDHHQDEEQDLFPLIVPRGGGDLVAQLMAQHREMDTLWALLAPIFDEPRRIKETLFCEPALHFARLNESHVAYENAELLPLAARLLTSSEIRTLGEHMARRRGIDFMPGSSTVPR